MITLIQNEVNWHITYTANSFGVGFLVNLLVFAFMCLLYIRSQTF